MGRVSIRGGFSDRNTIKPESTAIQLTSFDKRTRIQLQNILNTLYSSVYEGLFYGEPEIQNYIRFVLGTIYSEAFDTRLTYSDDAAFNLINDTIINGDYDDVLSVIEAIIQYWDSYLKRTRGASYYNEFDKEYYGLSLYVIINEIFKKEYVGYRFVDDIIVQISDPYEIESIEKALNNNYDSVYEHISKSNILLADREHPDYENSIKESISAVEALCEELTGIRGREATLGKMLKKIEEKGVLIHSSLKIAFDKLYGYTSDANGIRHAGDIGGPSSTFEEAKFMLVTCCAFINYLTALNSD